jgi:hypothetical protein
MLFIAISAALGFGAARYGEYRDDRELAARILSNVAAELEQNAATLRPMLPVHREWVAALANGPSGPRGASALDVYFAARPQLPPGVNTSFPLLHRSAWDAAVAGGGLRLINYELATGLSAVYRMQEITTDNIERLARGALSTVATYDPASRAPATRLLWLTLADIHSAEDALLRLYDRQLPQVRAAAGSPAARR